MKMVTWLIQSVLTFVGLVATYFPLYADAKGIDIWNIAWQYWAMIGATILWLSLGSIIIRLFRENRRLHSKEYSLQMEKLEREVKQLRTDQITMDTGRLF
jgi:hypothetical protein